MDLIKSIKSVNLFGTTKINVCANCKRSEKDLTGSNLNTKRGYNIFSRELLCIDCEILVFPGRFHGCGFCKRPIREKFSCTVCSNGFIDWVKESIDPQDIISNKVCNSASDLISDTIESDESRQFILRTNDGNYSWPGFYGGITNRFSNIQSIESLPSIDQTMYDEPLVDLNIKLPDTSSDLLNDQCSTKIVPVSNCFPVWIIPRLTIDKISLTDIKLDLRAFQNILLEVLRSNSINLYNDVQIDAESFSVTKIIKINPYDTRIFAFSHCHKN